MSEERTVKDWLALGDELGSELQKVLPDLQKIDWNTAMKWARKTDGAGRELYRMYQRYVICLSGSSNEITFAEWLLGIADPRKLLIAAATVKGATE